MIVRLTYVNFSPQKVEEGKKIFNEEIAPVVRRQKGNVDCKLLEPVDKNNDYISMTTWETQADADAYDKSGLYKELVGKVRNHFSKEPVLKLYTAETVMQPA